MDLSPFTRAGLKQVEISQLVGVTQTTVGLWMRGQRQPHFLLEESIGPILKAVRQAVEDGELPLPSTVPREMRFKKIQKVLDARLSM